MTRFPSFMRVPAEETQDAKSCIFLECNSTKFGTQTTLQRWTHSRLPSELLYELAFCLPLSFLGEIDRLRLLQVGGAFGVYLRRCYSKMKLSLMANDLPFLDALNALKAGKMFHKDDKGIVDKVTTGFAGTTPENAQDAYHQLFKKCLEREVKQGSTLQDIEALMLLWSILVGKHFKINDVPMSILTPLKNKRLENIPLKEKEQMWLTRYTGRYNNKVRGLQRGILEAVGTNQVDCCVLVKIYATTTFYSKLIMEKVMRGIPVVLEN